MAGEDGKPIEGQDQNPGGGEPEVKLGPDGKPISTDGNQGAPPDGGKPKEGDQDKPKPGEPVIPEKYEITAPEGVELDTALLDKFTPLAKELKLDNAGVQKLANFLAEQRQAEAGNQVKAWEGVVDGWVQATKADPEIGGEKLGPALASAKAVVDKYGNDKLKAELFDQYGIGNHPEVIRFLAKVGADMADDKLHGGSGGGGGEKSAAEVLYPDMTKKG